MGKRIVSVLLCALLLCLCAGCGSYKADASFTYLLEQNVTSLDPQTASNSAAELVISSLFEGLCCIDEDGEAIQVAPHAEMVVRWKTDLPVEAGAYLRVKKEPRSE